MRGVAVEELREEFGEDAFGLSAQRAARQKEVEKEKGGKNEHERNAGAGAKAGARKRRRAQEGVGWAFACCLISLAPSVRRPKRGSRKSGR